jgi:hypothetical protein
MASEQFRRNKIGMLQDIDENEVTEHESLAGLLWTNYKK